MITRVFPGWYKVGIDIYDPAEKKTWCKQHIGFSDHDTWVYQRPSRGPGHFSFKDEKWALMFALRFA